MGNDFCRTLKKAAMERLNRYREMRDRADSLDGYHYLASSERAGGRSGRSDRGKALRESRTMCCGSRHRTTRSASEPGVRRLGGSCGSRPRYRAAYRGIRSSPTGCSSAYPAVRMARPVSSSWRRACPGAHTHSGRQRAGLRGRCARAGAPVGSYAMKDAVKASFDLPECGLSAGGAIAPGHRAP